MSYVETESHGEQRASGKDGRNVSEKAQGGGDDDGVVYLGRNSFKMKVGAQLTPPAGMPAPRATLTPPPVAKTPSPSLGTPRPSVLSYRPQPAALEEPGGGGKGRGLVVVGLCMIAFSCGVMTTVAVDRLWPRAKAQCVGYQAEATGIGVGAIAPIAAPSPPPAAPAAVASAAAPVVAEVLPAPSPEPAVAAATASPVPAPAVVSTPRAGRSAAARTPPGRAGARQRPAASAPKASLETMHPTGMFVDPFAD